MLHAALLRLKTNPHINNNNQKKKKKKKENRNKH